MLYIEALDFVLHFINLRFNQPNFEAYEQLELLLFEALAALTALTSNDFADEIEYLNPYFILLKLNSL